MNQSIDNSHNMRCAPTPQVLSTNLTIVERVTWLWLHIFGCFCFRVYPYILALLAMVMVKVCALLKEDLISRGTDAEMLTCTILLIIFTCKFVVCSHKYWSVLGNLTILLIKFSGWQNYCSVLVPEDVSFLDHDLHCIVW